MQRLVDERPAPRGQVDHVGGDIATSTCLCALYVDYGQLARTSEGWKIVNVLWVPR